MSNERADRDPTARNAKPAEDIVAILFALFGFIGGVVLHLTVRIPVITGLFLGTGVASVAYGCLGGIQNAMFGFGPLKVGGSLAALAGVAFMTTQQLQAQQDREEKLERFRAEQIQTVTAVPITGEYEWQWAGDGWITHITVDANGIARIKDSARFVTCGGKLQTVPLVEHRDGKAELKNGGLKLEISIPVRFIQYEGCKRKGLDAKETVLTGELDRKAAYAGLIQYRPGDPPGDMILVKDYRSAPHFWNVAP